MYSTCSLQPVLFVLQVMWSIYNKLLYTKHYEFDWIKNIIISMVVVIIIITQNVEKGFQQKKSSLDFKPKF